MYLVVCFHVYIYLCVIFCVSSCVFTSVHACTWITWLGCECVRWNVHMDGIISLVCVYDFMECEWCSFHGSANGIACGCECTQVWSILGRLHCV